MNAIGKRRTSHIHQLLKLSHLLLTPRVIYWKQFLISWKYAEIKFYISDFQFLKIVLEKKIENLPPKILIILQILRLIFFADISTSNKLKRWCLPLVWLDLLKCLLIASLWNVLLQTNWCVLSVSRSVFDLDVALKVVTSACDICLVKVDAGHRDKFLTQLATKWRNVGLQSSTIGLLQDNWNTKLLFEIANNKKSMKII